MRGLALWFFAPVLVSKWSPRLEAEALAQAQALPRVRTMDGDPDPCKTSDIQIKEPSQCRPLYLLRRPPSPDL